MNPYRFLKKLPPNAENAVIGDKATAMVWYLPYSETPYDVTRMTMCGTVEICFLTLTEAEIFFNIIISSGHIEKAELRGNGPRRGQLINEYCDEPG